MNAPTIVIALVIAGLLALAVRRLVRRGACSACEQHATCAASGAQCAGRTPARGGQPTVVALGMPGGLTRAPSAAVATHGDTCCSAPHAVSGEHPADTPAVVTAGR